MQGLGLGLGLELEFISRLACDLDMSGDDKGPVDVASGPVWHEGGTSDESTTESVGTGLHTCVRTRKLVWYSQL